MTTFFLVGIFLLCLAIGYLVVMKGWKMMDGFSARRREKSVLKWTWAWYNQSDEFLEEEKKHVRQHRRNA